MENFFEGCEKRLEISFQPMNHEFRSLRELGRENLEKLLKKANCCIVEQLPGELENPMSNQEVDSYLLSESSMFVYPLKVILKTCGKTTLLKLIPALLVHAKGLSLEVKSVKYTRGSFVAPELQMTPHQTFSQETTELNKNFYDSISEQHVLGKTIGKEWYLYSIGSTKADAMTLEMCMRGLAAEKASMFYEQNSGKATKMTSVSGIRNLYPDSTIASLAFPTCGYSMNAIQQRAISTIHVTPEAEFSFASFESCGHDNLKNAKAVKTLVEQVLGCFLPREFTVALHGGLELEALLDIISSLKLQNYKQVEEACGKTLGNGGAIAYVMLQKV